MHLWPAAPQWAIDAGYLGKVLIILALVSFLLSIFGWMSEKRGAIYPKIGKIAFFVGTASLFATIFILGTLFVHDQFEYGYVFSHGDFGTQVRYKIAGIWSGQQGSFLLWACTSSLFASLASLGSGPYRKWFTVCVAVFVACLCGILAYETPFTLDLLHGKALLPPFGAGLAPSLENYWVVIHPPTIFSGFGSLTVAAAYGLSAMLTKNVTDYVRLLRPWALLSTAILGLGLCFGGFWAYETLGWGGFWMWDPVENVSFVPWVLSIVLVHGLIVQSAKKQWIGPNLLFAGLPFLAFCYGTFLTRSGFLIDASIHSFAEMNKFALWILAGFVIIAIAFYIRTYLKFGKELAKEAEGVITPEKGISRQKFYTSGVILLSALAVSAAIGMSVPFFQALQGKQSKAVEEGLYHLVLVWFFVPIMLAMAIGPFVTWRAIGTRALYLRFVNVLALTTGSLGLIMLGSKQWLWNNSDPGRIVFPFHRTVPLVPWMIFLVGLCSFVLIANCWRLIEVARKSTLSVGGFVAHIGIAVLMAGMIISQGFQQKESFLLEQGDTAHALGYDISYQGMTHSEELGLLKSDNKLLFAMKSPNDSYTAEPGLYYIKNDQGVLVPMQWPYLHHHLGYDIYFTLFAPELDVWKDPITFHQGQTLDPNKDNIVVTYHGLKTVGSPGQIGTKFVAECTVRVLDPADNLWKTYQIQPSIEITQQGLQEGIVPIGKSLVMSLSAIDAATKSADLQVHFANPIYPIDLFYKPMVILVWAGAGLTFLGGLLAAFYRRVPRPRKPKAPKRTMSWETEENLDPGIGNEEAQEPRIPIEV